MKSLTKFIAITALASAASLVYAESAMIAARGPVPFNAIDLDGNGSISEEEFETVHQQRMSARAAEGRPMRGMVNHPLYVDFDTDHDGQLTPDELAAGRQMQMQKRQGMSMGRGQGRGRNMPQFRDFDMDDNGYIAEAEFYEARKKRVNQRAQQGYQMRNLASAPSYADIDLDGDAKISPQEFIEHQTRHCQQRTR